MSKLLVVSGSPAFLVNGKPFLDIKFVEGMRLYTELWGGPVSCILKLRDEPSPFGRLINLAELPFKLILLPYDKDITADDVVGTNVVLASGETHEYFNLPSVCRDAGAKLIYIIENIPKTRRQIILLEQDRPLFKKFYSILWVMNQEMKRRRSFKQADGIQANGYPAYRLYRFINKNTILYLDNRLSQKISSTEDEMQDRLVRLASSAPIRLVHSGRLETLKGSQDIIPIAQRLQSMNVNFTLDIFGTGSLEDEIRKAIITYNLQSRVKIHGGVDFETELVPFMRSHADIYLSCHRQSDPSCTYLENMGCGVAVVGYDNHMWSALCQESGAGWAVQMGDTDKIADVIAQAAANRATLAKFCNAARAFAQKHSFESEFSRRIEHIRTTLLSTELEQ